MTRTPTRNCSCRSPGLPAGSAGMLCRPGFEQLAIPAFARHLKQMRFWEIKWTPRKGDLVPALIRTNRAMLMRSFEADLLYLPTLWKGDQPLAALATLMDRRKRAFLFYMTGRLPQRVGAAACGSDPQIGGECFLRRGTEQGNNLTAEQGSDGASIAILADISTT